MKKLLFFLCYLTLIANCNINKQKKSNSKRPIINDQPRTFNWDDYGITLQPEATINYSQLLNEIQKAKITSDNISTLFENNLVNQIIPYWYGTPWDFNGHTNIPNKNNIACGYFVSTTLKHMGLNINRYKLAQQLPIHEAQTLSMGQPILEINRSTFENCFIEIKTKLKNGIHFIGLDKNHVGFVLKRKGEIFFIHSSYGTPQGVVIELAKESDILQSFSHFYIVELSTNKKLLERWKSGERIHIVTN